MGSAERAQVVHQVVDAVAVIVAVPAVRRSISVSVFWGHEEAALEIVAAVWVGAVRDASDLPEVIDAPGAAVIRWPAQRTQINHRAPVPDEGMHGPLTGTVSGGF